jgi:hypothetical protein
VSEAAHHEEDDDNDNVTTRGLGGGGGVMPRRFLHATTPAHAGSRMPSALLVLGPTCPRRRSCWVPHPPPCLRWVPRAPAAAHAGSHMPPPALVPHVSCPLGLLLLAVI